MISFNQQKKQMPEYKNLDDITDLSSKKSIEDELEETLEQKNNKPENLYKTIKPLEHLVSEIYLRDEAGNDEFPVSPDVMNNTSRTRNQISSHHRRSLQEKVSGQMVWGKQIGGKTVLLSSRDQKGVPFGDDIKIKSRLRIHGLFDGFYLQDIRVASEFMIANGLPTETIVSLKEITHIKLDGQLMDKAQFLKYLLDKAKSDGFEEDDAKSLLKNFDFSIIERDMPVGERLVDMLDCSTKEDLEEIMKRVFSFINTKKYLKQENEKV